MSTSVSFKNASAASGLRLAALAFVSAIVAGPSVVPHSMAQTTDFSEVEIQVLPVRDNIYMLVGAGGNITVHVSEQGDSSNDHGILVVDTMFADLSDKVLAAIRSISDQPIRYVINTHVHPDHVGGNAKLAAAGETIQAGDVISTPADDTYTASFFTENAMIVAHENVLNGMLDLDPAPPFEAFPTSTFYTENKDLFFNGEAIRILHQPNAHTDGDAFVFFRRTDVISAGDIFNTVMFPYIDVERGGTIQGIIDSLNQLIDLTVPQASQEGGTLVIPGHGRLSDESEVVEYRDMLTIIRDRIQTLIDQGMSLREVKQMRPTRGWDRRYGRDSGFWTTEQFVEAVYHELSEAS